MNELFNNFLEQFQRYSQSNPVISGVVSIWGLTVVTFIFREVPSKVWKVLERQFTVRLNINNTDEAFYHFMRWYEGVGFSQTARTLRLDENRASEEVLSAGYGAHYFFFRGRPFRLTRERQEGKEVFDVKETVEIVTIGRSQEALREIIKVSKPVSNDANVTKVYKWKKGHWELASEQPIRPFKTIILADKHRKALKSHLNQFRHEKEWYLDHGIPYKTGICLYGPPGTGKTSLVKAICGEERKSLYILSLTDLSDAELETAVDLVKEKSVLLIEDIDSYKVAGERNRGGAQSGYLTLSGLLNAVDGISKANDRILIITTNDIDALDPALLRPGRVDLKINLGFLDKETLKSAFKKFYPEFEHKLEGINGSITPAAFQNLVLQHKKEPEKVLELLYNEYGEEAVSLRPPLQVPFEF